MECTIRKWKMTDAAALAEILNNKHIIDNLRDGLPFPYTKADALHYINEMNNADKNTTFAFAIDYGGKLVGSIGIFRQTNIYFRSAEVGYYIDERFWNNGIASSAIEKACKYVFNNTDIIRIYAEPFARNTASCRALEKAGFQCEGILRQHAVKNGIVEDTKIYALLREV